MSDLEQEEIGLYVDMGRQSVHMVLDFDLYKHGCHFYDLSCGLNSTNYSKEALLLVNKKRISDYHLLSLLFHFVSGASWELVEYVVNKFL